MTEIPITLDNTTAWVRPHREPHEPWVKGEVIASWLAKGMVSDLIMPWACVAYEDHEGRGQLMVEMLVTSDRGDWIRICEFQPQVDA